MVNSVRKLFSMLIVACFICGGLPFSAYADSVISEVVEEGESESSLNFGGAMDPSGSELAEDSNEQDSNEQDSNEQDSNEQDSNEQDSNEQDSNEDSSSNGGVHDESGKSSGSANDGAEFEYGEAESDDEKKESLPGEEMPSQDEPTQDMDSLEVLSDSAKPSVTYRAHVQGVGWQGVATNGPVSGTTGLGLRMEALKVSLGGGVDGSVEYRAHVSGIGWQPYVTDGAVAGTTGRSLAMEAINIRLKGAIAEQYDIYYRAHVASIGWLDWAKNGANAGSSGYSLQLEAIQIRLVVKGGNAPGLTADCYRSEKIKGRAHVSSKGWLSSVGEGQTIGTTGQACSLEGFTLAMGDLGVSGSIQYQAHVAGIGWQKTVGSGQLAGTVGKALPIEATRISLTGQLADNYDVFYRAHVARYGWLSWQLDGEVAGTTGRALPMEALQIKIVKKGDSAAAARVCAIKGDRKSAVTIISDDGGYSSGVVLNRLAWQNGLRVSVAATVNNANANLSEWQAIEKRGNIEIVNHSYTHLVVSDEANVTDQQLRHEILDSRTFFESNFSTDQITFVTPGNSATKRERDMLRDNGFFAVRSGARGLNSLSPKWGSEEFEWLNLGCRGIGDAQTTQERNVWVDNAIAEEKWLIEMWHNIGTSYGYQTISEKAANEHMAYIKKKELDESCWVAPFTEAVKYFHEKEHVAVEAINVGSTIRVSLNYSDTFLPSNIFNYPLTVEVAVPSSCNSVTAKIGLTESKCSIKQTDSGKVVLIDLAPNENATLTVS